MPKKHNQPYNRYQPPQKSCGKVKYLRKHEAEQAAEESAIIQPDIVLRVYKCLNCRGWHLTRANDQQIENQ